LPQSAPDLGQHGVFRHAGQLLDLFRRAPGQQGFQYRALVFGHINP
jgi:hypothetical protein